MKWTLVAVMLSSAILFAKQPQRNHQGVLLRMENVPCGPIESNPVGNAVFGSPIVDDRSDEKLCPEYILRSEGLIYRVRQRSMKQASLLPVGATAQFHFERLRMMLQVEDFDGKTYEFLVMAVIPENHHEAPKPAVTGGSKPPE